MTYNKSLIQGKNNRAKLLIILAIAWILMQLIISGKPLGLAQIHSISPETKILELQFSYSQETAHETLAQMGETGRKAYSNLLLVDFIYIIVYVCFFSYCLKALLIFFKYEKSNAGKIWVLPLFSGLLDIVENLFNLVQITTFPDVVYNYYILSNWVTMCKWVVTLGYEAIVAIGFFGYLFCLVKRKALKNKKEGK